jgi:hypothetical protein
VPDHEAVAELVAEVAQMGQALDGLVADQRRHAADLHRRLNSASESQAQLEEENALLMWLLAESEWKRSSLTRRESDFERIWSWFETPEGQQRLAEWDAELVTDPATSKVEPEKWKPRLVTGLVTIPRSGFLNEFVTGVIGPRLSNQGDGVTSLLTEDGDQRFVRTDSLRPAPTEPETEAAKFDRVAANVAATLKRDVNAEIEELRRKLQQSEAPRVWNCGDPEPEYVASVRDVHGDVWTRDHTGVWTSPETAPCGWGYMANKWAPLTEVVECDPAVVDLSLTRSQELERDAADMETHGGES